ncbi:uncharacterized protein LOC144478598 isoform X2 [Augochlora pura]
MLKRNRKRKLEREEQTMVDWEQENFFPDTIRNEMESMWEIPQIFHFLHLAREALNIPHLSMYEMERMLLIPRASKQLANIMTSLLSSPVTKAKLRKIPPMPYEFWTNILAYKMKTWFKVYEGKRRDAVKVLETIGVEPEFWNIFPDAPLLNGKDFEELSFRQKVWLLKTVCDTVMHTRKTVQEEVTKQPWEDQFETLLGTDRYGTRYIYFPQFLKTDLRVYRHSLDNTILSTVKPMKTEGKSHPDNKLANQVDVMWNKTKQRKRKARWSNGLPPKSKKKVNKYGRKDLNDCECISDSARDSLINEDTNLSSTSTCSNNNNSNSNNNNINLDIINGKRSRSLSKCSEMSVESDKLQCKNFKSTSGYDTSSSMGTVSDRRSSQKMFKGFSSGSKDKCNINIISNILSDLKADEIVENKMDKAGESVSSGGVLGMDSPSQQYLESIDQYIDKRESLNNSSKTDDEKLHEIVSVKCLDIGNQNSSDFHITTTSKSDDEKLNEIKGITERTKECLAVEDTKKEVIKQNGHREGDGSNNLVEKVPVKGSSSKNDEIDSEDDKDLSLSELRSRLQKEAMEEDFSMDEESEKEYNLRDTKNMNTDVWKKKVQNFNEMLSDLSVSNFQLIADSVSSFRDLISTMSQKCGDLTADTKGDNESAHPCELKLLRKMTELLTSLEEMESVLHDSTKKARGKLQKEWTNFKEGVEDQDSSGEGLGSNWWVLGSQGCPLPTPGDATIQTLPQPTLSSAGPKKTTNKDYNEESVNIAEPSKIEHEECKERQGTDPDDESHNYNSEKNEEQGNQATGDEKEEISEEEEQQNRRVLRARGISSYTEQFYSDDEIEEKELEEWADVEAVYAAPSTQIGSSIAHFAAKTKQSDDRTNEEDSDQDWILPSSRKRKNKRPSANRRLKSFQQKLQSIKVDELQEAAESVTVAPSVDKEKDQVKSQEISVSQPKNLEELASCPPPMNDSTESSENITVHDPKETVPSAETTCKIENIESVHSELDIKDEGPIYDYPPHHLNNSYPPSINPNYVMVKTESNTMNYYVMQSNMVPPQTLIHPPGSLVSNVVPSMPPGYYMQGGQNYIIQNPQSGYVPAQAFQPQGPQMLTPQQFVGQPGYLPYMMTAAQPQRGYMTSNPQLLNQGIPQNPSNMMPSNQPMLNRPPQIRYPPLRQTHPHPNGAVIRSNMPIRGNSPRAGFPRAKMMQQQRGMPVKTQKLRKQNVVAENPGQKTTSLIVLSDSDDEIEMIITEKTGPEADMNRTKTVPRRNQVQKNPTVTSDMSVSKPKSAIPPQIMQRMSQGGISITPVKPAQPVQNASTQLVVVVNETGSHYALALPNGSKLILTPEQVAQIRASNGGKLIL